MRRMIVKERMLVSTVTLLRVPFTVLGIVSLFQSHRSSDCRWAIVFVAIISSWLKLKNTRESLDNIAKQMSDE